MLALIRMDWTLSRGLLLKLSPIFALWLAVPVVAHGTGPQLYASFVCAAVLGFLPLGPYLAPGSIEPFLCALPVSRGQIVTARYLSALAGTALGLLLPIAIWGCLGLAGWFHQPRPEARDLALGLCLQAQLLATFTFLFLPFHFRFPGDRGLAWFGAAALGAGALLVLGLGWGELSHRSLILAQRYLDGGAFLLGAFLALAGLGALSLWLSIRGYRGQIAPRPLAFWAPAMVFLPVVALAVGAARSPVVLQAPATREVLDGLVSPLVEPGGPGCAVLVVKDGRVLLRKAYGLADLAGQVPLRPGDVFRIGSLTKQFTAALVLRRVEEGRLALAAPVRNYVPEVPAAWAKVTVEQCLRHTAGLPEYTMAGLRENEDLSPDRILQRVRGQSLAFEPGTSWQYSNTGYLLLGMALERVTGRTYARMVAEDLAGPLGLAHTGAETDSRSVQGYVAGTEAAGPISLTQPFAAGCMVSTVDDLAAWTLALHGGKVLKPASLKLMLSPGRTPDGLAAVYGMGLGLKEAQGRMTIGHAGAIAGFVCALVAEPGSQAVAVVLCNTMAPKVSPEALAVRLLDAACGRPRPEPRTIALAEADLEAVAGTYVLEAGPELRLRRDGQRLLAGTGGPAEVELFAQTRTRFFLRMVDASLNFQMGPDGRASGFTLEQDGKRIRARRRVGSAPNKPGSKVEVSPTP